jgi:hypothetical protein
VGTVDGAIVCTVNGSEHPSGRVTSHRSPVTTRRRDGTRTEVAQPRPAGMDGLDTGPEYRVFGTHQGRPR